MTAFMPDAHTLFTSVQLAAEDSPACRAACRPGACERQQPSLEHSPQMLISVLHASSGVCRRQHAPPNRIAQNMPFIHASCSGGPKVCRRLHPSLSLALHEHLLKPAAATACEAVVT